MRHSLSKLVVSLFLVGLCGVLVVASGVLDPAADRPHSAATRRVLELVRDRGVQARIGTIDVPPLDDPGLVRRGASNYDAMCAYCHARPGTESEAAQGMLPPPPDFTRTQERDAARTFWIVEHGLEMTGMPAWGAHLSDAEIWELVAFIGALPTLDEAAYDELVAAGGGHHHHGSSEHGAHQEHEAHDEHQELDTHDEHHHEHESGHNAEPPGTDAHGMHPDVGGHASHHHESDDPTATDHSAHDDHSMHEMGSHQGSESLLHVLSMRAASGTAWQPDATPMHAVHAMAGPFMLMAHGNVFVFLDAEGSQRGATEVHSVNWVMGHAELSDRDSAILARAMLSLEPVTITNGGYPLVGQTGETYEGEPLHDRQHPHDLFMELALIGRQTFGDQVGVEIYAAPAGEPALGPVAFPHRASAISDPIAPLGHHWQDSTHISFGVLTAGLSTRWAKLEGSWFNGREPDENRWDLDLDTPDSWSARLSVAPIDSLSAQVSYGYLGEPEALEPGVSVRRMTASIMHVRDLPGEGSWASTAAWGRNVEDGDATDSLLVESNLAVGHHANLFGRAEYVVKTAADLVVETLPADEHVPLSSIALGNVFTVHAGKAVLGLGVRGDLVFVPDIAQDAYGTAVAPGGVIYLQGRPAEAPPIGHGSEHH